MDKFTSYISSKVSVDPENYNFSDYPIFTERKIYDECRSLVVSQLSDLKGVSSVYSMGNVSAPGISDLDFLIVVSPDFTEKDQLVSIFENLSKEHKYLAYCHFPYVAFTGQVNDTLKILPLSNLNHEYGENHNLEDHSYSTDDYLIVLKELIVLFYPNLFLEPILNKNIAVRNIIQKLNGLTFPITFAKELGFTSEEFDAFEKNLKEIKSIAFDENQKEFNSKLVELLKLGLIISYRLIDFIDGIDNTKTTLKNTYSININTIFVKNYSATKSFRITYFAHRYLKFIPKLLPIKYAAIWFKTFNFLEKRSDLEVEDSQNEFLSRIQIYKDYMNKLSKTNLTEIVPYPFVYRLYGPESKFKKIIFKVYSIFS
jgi:hypothetical protein